MGVGGSFDVVAGVTARAPKLLQALGFEWLFRLMQEPKRMFKRYLIGNTKFLLLLFKSLLSRLRIRSDSKNG
jgi:N-acetylglucosaminyldiphosphoundecaprenol N-acetyl-beta-D-mannosaminyltransferase